jgi:hypothetical protein
VIKRCGAPGNAGVACFAVGREAASDMGRVCGFLEISCVTIITDCRCARVAVIHVALDTRYRHMGAGQWESRRGMVERCGAPGNAGVACFAVGREAASDMGGVCGFLEIGCVTIITDCRCARVAIVYMALSALDCHMGAGQWESRRGMVERCGAPGNRGVACFAVGREAASDMGGVCGFLEIGLVAPVASCRRTRETVIEMTLCARDCRMGAGQRKGCPRMVVSCRRPRGGGVTHLAIEREGR